MDDNDEDGDDDCDNDVDGDDDDDYDDDVDDVDDVDDDDVDGSNVMKETAFSNIVSWTTTWTLIAGSTFQT